VDNLKAPYVVRREGDGWAVLPSAAFAGLAVGMFAAGSAFMVYLSILFLRHIADASAMVWIGVIFLLVAGYSAVLAMWSWRTRRTPLSIEAGGRVCYGNRELCAMGTVRAVRILDVRGGEAGECEIALELSESKLVYLPNPYFTRSAGREHARPLAAKLAELLRVQVTES
jgi:hypothetical protein